MFRVVQRRGLACCACRHQSVCPFADLLFDKRLKAIFIDRTILEWRNERHE